MDKLIITGRKSLKGFINIHGSKNAALPIMVSSLLSYQDLILENIPNVEDISNMQKLLKGYGSHIKNKENSIIINNCDLINISENNNINPATKRIDN